MKNIFLLGIIIPFMFLFLTACVPWGQERYFQVSFIQSETDSNFEIELLLLTDYSGERPPSKPTNTLFINISEDYPSISKPPETVKFEIENTNINGIITVGDTIEIDSTNITSNVINSFIEENQQLNLKIEYIESQNNIINETIILRYNGAPVEYYIE